MTNKDIQTWNFQSETQVCYVQILDIKQNGGSLRGTIVFRFVLRPNVSRLSGNSQDGICAPYMHFTSKATKASFNLCELHVVSFLYTIRKNFKRQKGGG